MMVAGGVDARLRGRVSRIGVATGRGSGFATVALVAWCMLGAVAIAAAVTYWRVPARELYQVRHAGIDLAVRRSLAFAAYPAAPVAIAIVWLLAERFTRKGMLIAAVSATVLGSSVFWPGAVDETDPDARPINVVALLAVLIGIVLTIGAARADGVQRPRLGLPGDRLRALFSGLLVVAAIPWLAAAIGVSLDHVPGINSMFLSDSFVDQPGVQGLHPAVHAGLHHGLSGVMIVTSTLWLSRGLSEMRGLGHRRVLGGYLSLLIAYGGANALQDFWLEQIVKRDLLGWHFPYMLQPKASWAFAIMLAVAVLVYVELLRPGAILSRAASGTRSTGR